MLNSKEVLSWVIYLLISLLHLLNLCYEIPHAIKGHFSCDQRHTGM